MTEKREKYKFTIQFSPGDPLHQQTADILNQQGRRKAQFIVNAVQHYIHCSETPEIPQAPPVDTSAIEVIVRRILEEQSQPQKEAAAPTPKSPAQPTAKRSEEIQFDEASELLGKDGLAAIASTMAQFRR